MTRGINIVKCVFRKVCPPLAVGGSGASELAANRFTSDDLAIGDCMQGPGLTQNHFQDVKTKHDNNCAIEFVADGEEFVSLYAEPFSTLVWRYNSCKEIVDFSSFYDSL